MNSNKLIILSYKYQLLSIPLISHKSYKHNCHNQYIDIHGYITKSVQNQQKIQLYFRT